MPIYFLLNFHSNSLFCLLTRDMIPLNFPRQFVWKSVAKGIPKGNCKMLEDKLPQYNMQIK